VVRCVRKRPPQRRSFSMAALSQFCAFRSSPIYALFTKRLDADEHTPLIRKRNSNRAAVGIYETVSLTANGRVAGWVEFYPVIKRDSHSDDHSALLTILTELGGGPSPAVRSTAPVASSPGTGGTTAMAMANLADNAHTKELTPSPKLFEFVYQGEIIKITVRYLGITAQGTGYTLFKQRAGGAEFYVDIIYGHTISRVVAEDIDGDGAAEIIVLYHCGAHSMGMNIYSLRDPRDLPTLIDGGKIGSDWPEFSWEKRTDGPGSIITKKDRDWSGVPVRDFNISRYIVENGACRPLSE
jgi:hypothetical protein